MNKYGISEAKSRIGFTSHAVRNISLQGKKTARGWFLRGTVFVAVMSLMLSGFTPADMVLATNTPPTPAPCGTELIANGDFETPAVNNADGWNAFSQSTAGLAWKVNWLSPNGSAPSPAKIELHDGVNGWASQGGSQHTELDSDYQGPGGASGEPASVKIFQDLTTVNGATYDIEFYTSPRPDQGPTENVTKFSWDGNLKDTITEDGSSNSNTVWTKHSYSFTATGTTTRIQFADGGTPNSLGPLVDSVSVKQKCPSVPNLHLIKVVCDQYSDIKGHDDADNVDATGGKYAEFSNYNNGNFTPSPLVGGFVDPSEIPASQTGCARADGWSFKLATDLPQTQNVSTVGPTASGEFVTPISGPGSALSPAQQTAIVSGQLWISEVTQNGYDFAAIRCYNDALNGDNLEFITLGQATPTDIYCIAYNVAKEVVTPGKVTVTIVKHLDGAVATAGSANNTAFPMQSSWNDPGGIGAGAGNYDLSANNPNPYYATTSDMLAGTADYATNEVMGAIVAAECGSQAPYMLEGYSVGDDYATAVAAAKSLTSPSFTDLTTNKFVVVHNKSCTPPVDPECDSIISLQIVSQDIVIDDQGSCSISGYKYEDLDGDGVFDSVDGEAGLKNWKIYIDVDNDDLWDPSEPSDLTDSNGAYSFNNLPAGSYTIREENQTGWTQTGPIGGEHSITLVSSSVTDKNFFNRETSEVPPCTPNATLANVFSHTSTSFKGLTLVDPAGSSNDALFTGGPANAVVATAVGFLGAWDAASNDPDILASGADWVNDTANQPSNPTDAGGNGAVNSWRLFSQTFTIPAGATNISLPILHFTSDNSVQVFLNDNLIDSHGDFATVADSDPLSLSAGVPYTLEFVVKNDAYEGPDNPTGVLYNLDDITYCINVNIDTRSGGGGDGGGGSSGSKTDEEEGEVLGDTTTTPSTPTVAGATTTETLPVTGSPIGVLFTLFAIAAAVILPKFAVIKAK